jgi:hypothetical protein
MARDRGRRGQGMSATVGSMRPRSTALGAWRLGGIAVAHVALRVGVDGTRGDR